MRILEIIKEDEDIDNENNDDIVVVGDSIALGLNGKVPGASVYGRKGLNSSEILSKITQNTKIHGGDLAVISVGSNDIVHGKGNTKELANNIKQIRTVLNADKYIWVLPYDKTAAKTILSVIGSYPASTDRTLDLSKVSNAGRDGVHPDSYDLLSDKISFLQKQLLNLDSDSSGWIQHPGSNRKDTNIEKIQKLLISLDPPYNLGPKGVDGSRGPYTTAAIKEFQTTHGLKPTGEPTQETIDVMNKLATTVTILDKPVEKEITNVTNSNTKMNNVISSKEMASYLSSKGLDKNSIAGLIANAQGESNLNAGSYVSNDSGQGQGGGLFGFHDSKNGKGEFTNMVNSCGKNWQSNWQGQIDYALRASNYPKTGFKTPSEAAEWFVRNYERPKNPDKDIAKRVGFANNLAATLTA